MENREKEETVLENPEMVSDVIETDEVETSDEQNDEKKEKEHFEGIKITVKISEKDMADFMLKHAYSSISGWFGVVLSVAALIYLVIGYAEMIWSTRIALLFIGVLFTIVNPVMLVSKAKKQVKKNKMFEVPIDYILSEKVLVIEQGEEQLTVPWENIQLVRSSKRSLIVYITKNRACIWPKAQIGAQYKDVEAFLTEKMGSARVRISKQNTRL